MRYPEELELWLALYLQGNLDEPQKQKLQDWLNQNPAHMELLRKLQKKTWQKEIQQIALFDQKRNWQDVMKRIARRHRVILIQRASIAACIATLVCLSCLFFLPESQQQEPVTIARIHPHEVKLNTASGMSYSLDSTGKIMTKETLLKSNGKELKFKPRQQANAKVEWNTVIVPRGTTYKVELSDQTEVTLNAESVLHFPNYFEKDKKREIWLTGEAYFNVTQDTTRPFVVHSKHLNVKVLGTKFNLMAYEKADKQQVTLIQGKVKVENEQGTEEVILTPEMQASFDKKLRTINCKKVNTSYYTAWQQDLFAFRETPLREVMRTLAQWYDFEVFFQNPEVQDFTYTGKIKRYETLNEVLENFREMNELEFSIRDKTVVVSKVS